MRLLGFWVWVYRIQGFLGFRVLGFGLTGLRVYVGFRVQSLRFWDLELWVSGLRSSVSVSTCKVSTMHSG